VAKAVSGAGASALCVATLPEALELRVALPDARIIVMGPVGDDELAEAGTARVELVAAAGSIPENVPVHLELDTGMGRWGLSELPSPARNVVGVMSHFAASEADPDFTRLQIDRFRDATQDLHGVSRHLANSAGTLRFPEAAFDAVRCGIALYGISLARAPVTTARAGARCPAAS
jgi:alanine racemase